VSKVGAAVKTSDAGVRAICAEEGCVLHTYRCPAGVLTIGYGHTGPDVTPGLTITQAEAEALLRQDLARFEAAVTAAVGPRVSLTQCEFDSLVSLAYNIGAAAFAGSTLVRRLRAGDRHAAAAEFTVWNRAGGVFSPALLRRRTRELLRFAGAA
jgi:lysozyme